MARKSKAIPGLKALQMRYARDCRMIAGSTAIMIHALASFKYFIIIDCLKEVESSIRRSLKYTYQLEKARLIQEFEDAKSRQ